MAEILADTKQQLSDKNPAHIWTWSRITGLGMTNRPFKEAGSQTMGDLNGNNSAASPKVRAAWAAQRAWELFRLADTRYHRHQKYQTVSDESVAQAIAALIFSPQKTILDMANQVDEIFIFPGEKKDTSEEGKAADNLLVNKKGKSK
mgnify:CR=1 FL=1